MKRIFYSLLLICQLIVSIYAGNVYISGDTIAISLSYDGVLITDTYIVNTDGTAYHMGDYFQQNDIIVAINGITVSNIEELNDYLSQSDLAEFTVIRNNKIILVTVDADINPSTITNGLHLRDKVSGIGTITYFDPATRSFGSLGHSLVTNDSVVKNNGGSIYDVDIYKISHSSKGIIGEKIADTSHLEYMGEVSVSNKYGVYGKYIKIPETALQIEVGEREEVHEGEAFIYTQLDNDNAKLYKIYIDRIEKQQSIDIKGFHFKIVDEELIAKTGGIVQGMSGSPIIQDGKLIGACTHVVVNNPIEGYGIYIEFMLQQNTNN